MAATRTTRVDRITKKITHKMVSVVKKRAKKRSMIETKAKRMVTITTERNDLKIEIQGREVFILMGEWYVEFVD